MYGQDDIIDFFFEWPIDYHHDVPGPAASIVSVEDIDNQVYQTDKENAPELILRPTKSQNSLNIKIILNEMPQLDNFVTTTSLQSHELQMTQSQVTPFSSECLPDVHATTSQSKKINNSIIPKNYASLFKDNIECDEYTQSLAEPDFSTFVSDVCTTPLSSNKENTLSHVKPSTSAHVPELNIPSNVSSIVLLSSKGLTETPKIKLINCDIWNQLHCLTNEMQISKKGRIMFPELGYKIQGLNPHQLYKVTLKIKPVDKIYWKFLKEKSCWIQYKTKESEDLEPATVSMVKRTGASLMQNGVHFEKVKFTNDRQKKGIIVLESGRKYHPYICLSEVGEEETLILYGSIKETQFIAVTTFKNSFINELKMKHNPYSKTHQPKRKSEGTDQAPCNKKVCSVPTVAALPLTDIRQNVIVRDNYNANISHVPNISFVP